MSKRKANVLRVASYLCYCAEMFVQVDRKCAAPNINSPQHFFYYPLLQLKIHNREKMLRRVMFMLGCCDIHCVTEGLYIQVIAHNLYNVLVIAHIMTVVKL